MHILEGLARLTDGATSCAEQTQYGNMTHWLAKERTERLIARLQHENLEEETARVHALWLRRQPECEPSRRL